MTEYDNAQSASPLSVDAVPPTALPDMPVSAHAQPQPAASDVDTQTIALVGILGAIVIVAIIFALQVLYYRAAAGQFREKDLDQPVAELQKVLTAQQMKLAQFRLVDPAKGVVTIPIERAMELVVQEAASGPNRPSSATPPATGGTNHAKP